jgi:hypothetical protein
VLAKIGDFGSRKIAPVCSPTALFYVLVNSVLQELGLRAMKEAAGAWKSSGLSIPES